MKNNIYVALDFKDWETTQLFLNKNNLQGIPVKVGMELFYKEGPDVVSRLRELGHEVFLDVKLHDIPNTVYRAMKNIAKLDVSLVTIHAQGGKEMIRVAKEGLMEGGNHPQQPLLIAVTVLTSIDENMLNKDLLISESIKRTATHFARSAYTNGADGVVCSVQEVQAIKRATAKDFFTITPGIRLENGSRNDQKRIATPAMAKATGADALVIGRSITQAADPRKAYLNAKKEWE